LSSIKSKIVQVLLSTPLDQCYSYVVPDALNVQVGDIVNVPLRNRKTTGVVWETTTIVPSYNLKYLLDKIDTPSLSQDTRQFIDWVAAYTLTPRGQLLKMALSVPKALEEEVPKVGYILNQEEVDARVTLTRQMVIDALNEFDMPLRVQQIAQCANVGESVVRGMIKVGFLTQEVIPEPHESKTYFTPVKLSPQQELAANSLRKVVKDKKFSASFLDGVTGSGKTEVYFEAIVVALSQNKQALVLLPEIALSPQWVNRFYKRFGFEPTLWHSGLSDAQRCKNWRAIARGHATVIVGARSALFLPYPDLGVVVVDEEHEPSYKQEEKAIYHARDMAVVRAHLSKIPIILSSATPSLETWQNVVQGRYNHVELPTRFGAAVMPDIKVLDQRDNKQQPGKAIQWLMPELRHHLESTLAAGEQSLLFLNRRGYAPLTLCKSCGSKIECLNCSAWLVNHQQGDKLLCHLCGHKRPIPKKCDKCQDEDSLTLCGPGVERVAEEVRLLLPQARLCLMTSDTITNSMQLGHVIDQIQRQEVDIVIGTQMVAKGHHFPHLTFVGIVDADLGLQGGDLRACEKTFQLLHQVSGRAGRAERPGKVMLQTYHPDHPVIQAIAADDRSAFLTLETQNRQDQTLPPYGRLAAFIVSSTSGQLAEEMARTLVRYAPQQQGIDILGPAPAPIVKIRGRYRWRILIKGPKEVKLQPYIKQWLSAVDIPNQVRVQVDIDPYSFL
jgi:primosomal protein N' (replication factor Y)